MRANAYPIPYAYGNFSNWKEVPFDLFCPKEYDQVSDRSCPKYHIYLPSKKAMAAHKKIQKLGSIAIPRPPDVQDDDGMDEDEEVDEEVVESASGNNAIHEGDADKIPYLMCFLSWIAHGRRNLLLNMPNLFYFYLFSYSNFLKQSSHLYASMHSLSTLCLHVFLWR